MILIANYVNNYIIMKGEETMRISKRLDELGRVVLSKDLRNWADISLGEELITFIEDGKIVFEKITPDYEAVRITKKVDGVGRILVPIHFRDVLDITDDDDIMIYVEDGRIIFEKCVPVEA